MRICAAQTRPFTGDIARNIAAHKQLIELAATEQAELIIFPELSITGYQPALAKDLATTPSDPLFDVFQQLSNQHNMIVGIGAPTKGNCITMILFHPLQPRQTYSKKYLHADEEPFFISGQNASTSIDNHPEIALAICYEISIPEHAENAKNADIYFASVAKTPAGVSKANLRLAEIAKQYSMTVIMSNSIGDADGGDCGGNSAVWNNQGILVAQMDDANEGILVFDTETQHSVIRIFGGE